MSKKKRGTMPSKKAIVNYWANCNHELDDNQFLHDQCFACGYFAKKSRLDRCHIIPSHIGGDESLENLHILCRACHQESEHLYGDIYWEWYEFKINNEFDFGLRYDKHRWLTRRIDEFATENNIRHLSPEDVMTEFRKVYTLAF